MTAHPSAVPGSAVPGSAVPGRAVASAPAGWGGGYTTNFNPNPSAEVSTAGYAPLLGTEQAAQDTLAYSGSASLKVITPGNVPGEGISTPGGAVVAAATGSATAWIYGETGTLTVQALQNPGGQVLATAQVQLDGQDWQRVELDNLAMASGSAFYLAVYTTVTQALTFWVDAVQYEPESPAHPYVDGDSQYGTWTGTPGLSTSYRQFQHPAMAGGGMVLEGTISVVAMGEIFVISGTISGPMDMSGDQHQMAAVSSPARTAMPPAIDPGVAGLPWEIAGGGVLLASGLAVISPGSGFADFAIFETGVDPDPAMTLIGWNNAGTQNAAGTATAYTRLFGTFSPPRQSLDSNGNARWQAAAYMAAGFRVGSQPVWAPGAPGTVNFADVQVEKSAQQGPSAYQYPRSLTTIIRPTRMNYVPNPSFETTGANWDEYWSAIGGATLTQVAGGTEGTYRMQVSVPSAAGGGVYVTIPGLITGDTFAASAYTSVVSANINDITMKVAGASASSAETGLPYGDGQYGAGPYGGAQNPATPLASGGSYRPFTSFTAAQSSLALSFVPVAVTGAAYPLVFTIEGVLVEPGEVLGPYGDGSSDGWQWELGGTPGLCRSYYYERESVGVNAVGSVLQQHIPLGLTAYAPQYFVAPTQ